MVHLDRITTRGGDGGRSRLADGTELAKDHPVFAALGDVDECNSALGVARLQPMPDPLVARLAQLQNDLFDLGGDLATPPGVSWEAKATRVTAPQVARLEAWIAEAGAKLSPLTSFILPGGCPAAAHLHVARAVARRAERSCLAAWPLLPGIERRAGREPLLYLNRLSDLLFQWARLANDGGLSDALWKPGADLSARG